MEENNKKKPKDRILEAAEDLFYRQGIQAVGMDLIAKEANVAIKTLYRHFSSKDELIKAYLEKVDQRWLDWMKDYVQRASNHPKRKLLAVFDALDEWFNQEGFRGCAFINAAGELGLDKEEAHQIACNHKLAVSRMIRDLVKDLDMNDETLVHQLQMLVEGAIVLAYITNNKDSAKTAKKAAITLIEQSQMIQKQGNK
ncbi:TetR/AcrR family transcriptional regulator [Thermoactinomyces sp. CICC 10521]|uniref:TetR/AcrR family transcriptional regulator n=1 Tax=Thermoactinomyces sp. CICC 10521 TaxID=2767426 RepID=UPI0018DCA089|nr:TetR/AcrR family transcriptional regulator [Thermoactinomyces sp. CICC 10521]MBH8609385.1 TetR/AcrR family transcriptional regulator [Thermoactinomyces sp. CICC 10521]